jgi:hypothetical protein
MPLIRKSAKLVLWGVFCVFCWVAVKLIFVFFEKFSDMQNATSVYYSVLYAIVACFVHSLLMKVQWYRNFIGRCTDGCVRWVRKVCKCSEKKN